jgi:hypothetical protein
VSRAGERILAIANLLRISSRKNPLRLRKDCFGATPKVRAGLAPARKTRALPNDSQSDIENRDQGDSYRKAC